MRRKLYTIRGIKRVPCARCGKPSNQQWQTCANLFKFVPCCIDCDIEVNRIVLDFFRIPDRKKLMKNYTRKMKGEPR